MATTRPTHENTMERIPLGISTCLLGEHVRYDGGHKHDRYITDTLGVYFSFVPVCPEAECGLGIPREAMRLVGDPAAPRLVTIRTGIDHTDRMQVWGAEKLHELESADLCGYIFKSRSPSSGMARVKVYTGAGQPAAVGVGIWARMFMERFPLVPCEDEGRLHDPVIREQFIERVFILRRWREMVAGGETAGRLVDFHTRHKLIAMAHSPAAYRELGRLVARAGELSAGELSGRYLDTLTGALRLVATPAKNANVLMHIAGYFKRVLTPDEKAELLDIIERYRTGQLPLIVPVTLANHYVRKYGEPYLASQYYLNPHPLELKLRTHV